MSILILILFEVGTSGCKAVIGITEVRFNKRHAGYDLQNHFVNKVDHCNGPFVIFETIWYG